MTSVPVQHHLSDAGKAAALKTTNNNENVDPKLTAATAEWSPACGDLLPKTNWA